MNSSLPTIKCASAASATALASLLRRLIDTWKSRGMLDAYSFTVSQECANAALTSFYEAAQAVSAYADLFGAYAADAAPLEDPLPYSSDRLYVLCAAISDRLRALIPDVLTALGDDGGTSSPQKAAAFITDTIISLEAFARNTD